MPKADPVAKGHLDHGLRYPAGPHRPGGVNLALLAVLVEAIPDLPHGGAALLGVRPEEIDAVARLLELGREHLFRPGRGDGKGDQRGRDVQIHEGSRHGILAANGGHPQAQLGLQGPQQSGKGLAPASGVLPQALKVLLEGEIDVGVVTAGGHQLTH